MKRKKIKFTAGLLALAITVSMVPVTNYVKAAESEIRLAAVKEEKKVVKTVKELKAALKDSSVKNIEVKSSKSLKISLKGSYTDVSIVFKTPNAVITNSGKFKAVTVRAKKWVEKADNNNLTIKSEKGQVVIDKAAETGTISVAKKDALLLLKINGSVKNVEVSKKADLRLSGKADKVSVEIKGEGTKLSSSLPVEVKVLKTASIELKSGAEGSRIEKLNEKAEVTVDNKSESEVSIVDAKGVESALESGKTQEIKEEEKAENTTDTDEGKSTGNTSDINSTGTESGYSYYTGGSASDNGGGTTGTENKLGAAVKFEDARIKAALLKFFKEYKGIDTESDIPGEMAFKLSDTSYRKDAASDEIYEKEMRLLEAFKPEAFDEDYEPFNFTSLKGLETAVNLRFLSISSGIIPEEGEIRYSEGGISDLSPLSGLKKLEVLRLSHNEIENVEPLKDITSLKQLYISHNKISNISALASLTNLESLDLSYNYVRDISAVSNFNNLGRLTLKRIKVENIQPISELVKLTELDLSGNKITDVSALIKLTALSSLLLYDTDITSIEGIRNASNLRVLDLHNNRLNDAAFSAEIFRGLAGIEELNLNNTGITGIAFVRELPGLKELYINDNRVASLNGAEALTEMKKLHFNGNEVTDLSPIAGLTGMSSLRFENNRVENIDVIRSLKSLYEIYCSNNKITDFSAFSELTADTKIVKGQTAVIDKTVDISGKEFTLEQLVKGLNLIAGEAEITVTSDLEGMSIGYGSEGLSINLDDNAFGGITEEGTDVTFVYSFYNSGDFSDYDFEKGGTLTTFTVSGVKIRKTAVAP